LAMARSSPTAAEVGVADTEVGAPTDVAEIGVADKVVNEPPALASLRAALPPGKHTHLRARARGPVADASVLSKRLAVFSLSGDDACRVLLKDRDGFFSPAAITRILEHLGQNPGQNPSLRPLWATVDGFPEVEDGTLGIILHATYIEVEGVHDDGGAAMGKRARSATFEPDIDPKAAHAPPAAGRGEPPREEESKCAKGNKGEDAFRRSRFKVKKGERHQHFVAWLCATYGDEALRAGSGVLDVAGGAGGVAFELSVRREIQCTVVDPRVVKCTARQRRALRCHSERAPALRGGGGNGGGGGGGVGMGSVPNLDHGNSLGNILDGGLGGGGGGGGAGTAAAGPSAEPGPVSFPHGDMLEHCIILGNTSGSILEPTEFSQVAEQEGARPRVLPLQARALFDGSFAQGNAALLARCSVLVGMHPDEATESIVDLAVASRKPFALLPCCVFPTRFKQRRLPDGREVNTYEVIV